MTIVFINVCITLSENLRKRQVGSTRVVIKSKHIFSKSIGELLSKLFFKCNNIDRSSKKCNVLLFTCTIIPIKYIFIGYYYD